MSSSPLSPLVKHITKKINRNTKVCPTLSPASVEALDKYTEMKGFLSNTETARFIINAVLIKEGLLDSSKVSI